MSSNRDSLNSFFPIWFACVFFFFSYLTTLVKISSTMWNSSDKNTHLCHVTDLRGKASSFTIKCDISSEFFLLLGQGTSFVFLVSWLLLSERLLNFSNSFSVSVEITMWIFFFIKQSIDSFYRLKQSQILRILFGHNLFYIVLDLFC